MKIMLTILLIYITSFSLWAQPNCNYYKLQGDIKKYEACQASQKAAGHYQFSKEYMEAMDNAIAIDSTFAYAYKTKSTAYLKSGDFITWKQLMDLAVNFDARDNIEYRAWCRFQFFRDYQGAIDDIIWAKKLSNNHIGFSVNGDYHLDIALALCYKALGKKTEAIQIMQDKFADSTYTSGLYDHLHLGVLFLETGKYEQALQQFSKQEKINDLAENRFYTALTHKLLLNKDLYRENLNLAKKYYQNKNSLFDPYTEPVDKIYLTDILEEEQTGLNLETLDQKEKIIQRPYPD